MKLKIIKGLPKLVFSSVVINNGVKVHREFSFPSRPISFLEDLILILRSKFQRHNINSTFEAGVYLSHLRVTRPEDRILAVGLGSGTTLIPMVRLMDSSVKGFYLCIEASKSQIDIAKKNINLNNIDHSRFEILNGFAGSEVYGVYGKRSENNININEFEFDILELDCEGSELSILSNLKKRPRNIIVELHPIYFEEMYKDFDNFLMLMEEIGYTYQFAYGHNGDYLDAIHAREYYNSIKDQRKSETCIDDKTIHFFGVCPIVVTFKRSSI